jgi:hypothetical protein
MEMSTAKPKQPDVVAERLRNHKLSSPTFKDPADVVRWFGAVQAQDFHGAKWALALRMRKATNASVEEAFNRGEIVRTHLLRPTWHFIAPDDIRWLLQLTGPRVNQRCAGAYSKYELDAATFKRAHRAITKALEGGKQRTRTELKAALNRAGVAADDGVRLAHILLRAELDGVVCSGPRRGNQFTYTLLDESVAQGKQIGRDEALAELARRYFTSHGPASLPDYVWWSGLTTNDARRGIAILNRELEETQIEGTTYWSTNKSKRPETSAGEAHLLPAYDEYNVAYKNRQHVFDQSAVPQITTWGALGPTVLVNGRIVAIWKATVGRNSIDINVKPARILNTNEAVAVRKAATRYAAFIDLPGRVLICFAQNHSRE